MKFKCDKCGKLVEDNDVPKHCEICNTYGFTIIGTELNLKLAVLSENHRKTSK